MPFYRFLVHGKDVYTRAGARGFYTTRHAFARTQEEAAEKVLALLLREFTAGVSAALWRSGPPTLTIEDARPISIFQRLSAQNKGSTFYEN